ncbi:hypothetical protein D3C72_1643430 [compost metagenome]
MEDACAAIAIKRLQNDIAHFIAEAGDFLHVLGDQRLRHQIGEFGDENLFRRVTDPGGVIDDKRSGVNALQEVGGGDVSHVEGRILTQMDDIHGRQIDALRFGEREMVALDVAQFHLLHRGVNLAIAHGKALRRIMEQPVSACLRLEAHGEGGVTGDIDAGDMIHLDRDVLDLRHAHVPLAACGRFAVPPCPLPRLFAIPRRTGRDPEMLQKTLKM